MLILVMIEVFFPINNASILVLFLFSCRRSPLRALFGYLVGIFRFDALIILLLLFFPEDLLVGFNTVGIQWFGTLLDGMAPTTIKINGLAFISQEASLERRFVAFGLNASLVGRA